MKAVVAAFNQEKALVGAFSVIVKTDCETDGSFYSTRRDPPRVTLLLALRLAEALSPVGAAAHQAAALAGGGQGEGVRHRQAGGQQEGEEEGHLDTSDQSVIRHRIKQ